MMQRIITRKDLESKVKELFKDFEVIGPKELANKGIFYQPIINIEDLYLGNNFTVEPVKKFFLSPSECLFKESFEQGRELLKEIPLPETKRIIFGVRPCEARGLTLLDKVFDPSTSLGTNGESFDFAQDASPKDAEPVEARSRTIDSECKDNFYISNRKRTIIVGLSCAAPDKSCFCTSMGGSPVETEGFDALLFIPEFRGELIGDKFIVDLITDKGKEIFGSPGEGLNECGKKAYGLDREKRKNLVKTNIKIPLPESLDKIFEDDYWKKVSLPCLSCGICTFLCPTCHCFDLADEERKRLRCWDGCAFSDFTLEASGVNPRPTKKERYRQRVFHKFDYFKKNFGENLCVGCGRCIRHCPVKIDIAEVVDKAPLTQ